MNALPKLVFTVEETCETLSISRTTLWKLVRTGKLEPFRIGRCLRFTREALEDFLSRKHNRPKR